MIKLTMLVIILYYYSFVFYFQKIFPPKKAKHIQLLISIFIVVLTYMSLYKINMLWIAMIVIIAIMTVSLRLTTGMNWLQALYGGAICVISAYCARGILISILSFCFVTHIFLNDAKIYYTITIFALPISLLFFYILRITIIPDNKLKSFLSNFSQLKFVIVYEIIATINLTIINFGRVLSLDAIWYTQIALTACILTIGMLIYSTYQSIRSTEILEYQLKAQMLEEQFNRQLLHYKSYQRYTDSFLKFKHDNKSLMTTLKSILRAGEIDKAIDLIDDIYDDMNKKVQVHKKYSDSVVLDAILQDLANICEEEKIHFTSKAFSPKNTKLTLIDTVRVISNITNNAVEACLKTPASERFIDILCVNDTQWAMLQIRNSYNGDVILKNGKLITAKTNKNVHGFGLSIVKDIVEGIGGFVTYDIDSKKKIFQIRVHIPKYYE